MNSINNLDQLGLAQQSAELWNKLKSKDAWNKNLLLLKYTLNDTPIERTTKLLKNQNHIITMNKSNFQYKLENLLTNLKDINKNKSIIEIPEKLYNEIVKYNSVLDTYKQSRKTDPTVNFNVDLSQPTKLSNTNMIFYKCTNIDNLIKFFNNILLNINRNIRVNITKVDNKFKPPTTGSSQIYKIIQFNETPPKLYVHLFNIGKEENKHSISSKQYVKNIENTQHLKTVLETTDVKQNDYIITNIWKIIEEIRDLEYKTKKGPNALDICSIPKLIELYKCELEVKIFSIHYLNELFRRMNNTYTELYSKHKYIIDQESQYFNYNATTETIYQKVIIREANAKVCIIGDIHSSIHSLCEILERINKQGYFIKGTFKLKSDRYIIFLGDIVDRGPFSIELLAIISILKLNNECSVFIINGNHEESGVYNDYGLGDEVKFEYENGVSFDFLKNLPSCIILDYKGEKYHLCHGSFDVDLLDIKYKTEFLEFINNSLHLNIAYANSGADNLQWSDMNGNNGKFRPSRRGVGYEIPKPSINEYLTTYGIKSILSGHQDNINIGCIFKDSLQSIWYKKLIKTTKKGWSKSKYYKSAMLYTPPVPPHGHEKVLIPDDLAALVTSTATYSKHNPELNKNCYLELT